jgi:hypothetical protein
MEGGALPTIGTKGVFSFHPSVKVSTEMDGYIHYHTGIDVILSILSQKATLPPKVFKQDQL